jgi:HAD superfamily hydrolase (TIGR01484 family)
MKPLAALGREEASGLVGLLFDLDDTVLSHGLLTRDAYDALWNLKGAGLSLVAVTGRPCGWGEVIARQWPIDGVVAENGAVHIVRDGHGVTISFADAPEAVATRFARLDALATEVAASVPEAVPTDDTRARRTDIAWDIGERQRAPREVIARIVSLAERAGARTTQSSVHLHASFERDDKASGVVRFVSARFGVEASRALVRFAFVGDSTNDASCFAAFKTTFGVANVAAYVRALSVPPRYVASKERGEGFAEIAAALLALRRAVK